jgi:integrase
MRIFLTERIVRGKNRFCVEQRGPGIRKRTIYKTKAKAQSALDALTEQQTLAGSDWAALAPAERADALIVLREIRQAGKSLRQVWSEYQASTLTRPRRTLGDAVADTIAEAKAKGLRDNSVASLSGYLAQFKRGRESVFVDEFRPEDIDQWFTDRKEKPTTRQSNLGRLSTLFDLCWRRNWITENPCAKATRVRADREAPAILTVEQARKAMAFAVKERPEFLAWLSLALFAGTRPEETDRLKWSDVDLKTGIVKIDAAASKVRQRRIVHLEPAAIAWLTLAKKKRARLGMPLVTRRRYLRSVRDALGFKEWPADVLRHSCASYWLASLQDAGKVAHELGNSANVLLRHYKELVTKETAAEFWTICPKSS